MTETSNMGKKLTLEEWRRLYPDFTFSVMNQDPILEESFDVMPTHFEAAIIDEDEKEIVFETFWFDVKGWTARQVGEFVYRACFDEMEFEDDNTIRGWYD